MPLTDSILHGLADLRPKPFAVMHGSCFAGTPLSPILGRAICHEEELNRRGHRVANVRLKAVPEKTAESRPRVVIAWLPSSDAHPGEDPPKGFASRQAHSPDTHGLVHSRLGFNSSAQALQGIWQHERNLSGVAQSAVDAQHRDTMYNSPNKPGHRDRVVATERPIVL